jgi:lipid-binding SYLF domain-containing protein
MKYRVRQKRFDRRILSICMVAALLMSYTTAAFSRSGGQGKNVKKAAELSSKAAKAFDEIMRTPDKSIPKELLDRAQAVAVFPDVLKAAFIVGAEGGQGVVSRRSATGWSPPIFFRAAGGSFGAQLGVTSTDLVLLFMNQDGLDELLKDKFTLGAEASAAAGPVGREAGAATDVLMKAEILSYSRSRGLFAGVDLKGMVVKPDDELNEAIYHVKARDLLAGNEVATVPNLPANLLTFPQTLGRYSTK